MEKISIIMSCKEHLPYTLLAVKRLVECTVHDFELIIADDSKVPVEDAVRKVAPDLELKVLYSGGEREGAAEARNDCFRNASCKVCINADNDVVVTPGWDVPLVKIIEEEPKIGLLIPAVNDMFFFEPELSKYCDAFIRLRSGYREEQGSERLMAIIDEAMGGSLNNFAKKYVEKRKGHALIDFQNTWVSYAVRLDVFKHVGGYDEEYRLASHEDLDLAKRLNMLGFRTVVTRSAFIWHCMGTTRPFLPNMFEEGTKNKKHFEKKFSDPGLNPREGWVT